jgi:hypothetical protein
MPLYGPLSSTVSPAVASRWIERLLAVKQLTPDVASAIVQIGATTGDAARDVPDELRQSANRRLAEAGFEPEATAPLLRVVAKTQAESARAFGDSIPEGLRLDTAGAVA